MTWFCLALGCAFQATSMVPYIAFYALYVVGDWLIIDVARMPNRK